MPPRTWLMLVFMLITTPVCQQKKTEVKITPPVAAIPASEAADHIGEEKAVYGMVASARYVYWIRGQPTFLNLDQPYPDQIFSIVIGSLDRPKFGMPPEERFMDKAICVIGLIEKEQGLPQIVVTDPSQIQILKLARYP